MRAEFHQTLYDEDGRYVEDSHGVMYLVRPGRFRWDYAEPFPQTIVADGEQVWLYDPELEQVTVRPLDSVLGSTPAALLSGGRDVARHYEVEDLGTRDGVAWLELRPRAEEAAFTHLRLAFVDGALDTIELIDGFGQLTVLHFTAPVWNLPLDADLFRFAPPPEADVIDERPLNDVR